jgi:hypothetical protein
MDGEQLQGIEHRNMRLCSMNSKCRGICEELMDVVSPGRFGKLVSGIRYDGFRCVSEVRRYSNMNLGKGTENIEVQGNPLLV